MFILALCKGLGKKFNSYIENLVFAEDFLLHMFWACPRCVYDAWSDVWIDWRPSWCTDSKKFDISECIWIMWELFCTAADAFLADCDAGAGGVCGICGLLIFQQCRCKYTTKQRSNCKSAILNSKFSLLNTTILHF